MAERTFFINGIPALYEALKRAGREKEAQDLIENFLRSSFAEDLNKKIERFLRIPGGIFPADMEYFRILWELNQIYISGLYYSTVVLAGVLCERMCHDILARNSIKPKDRSCLNDLIRLIEKKKLAKKRTITHMDKIRDKRNSYVHPAKKKRNTEKTALDMIERISKILHYEFHIKDIG